MLRLNNLMSRLVDMLKIPVTDPQSESRNATNDKISTCVAYKFT